ncbi:tol-pal system protein YbgF [Methylobacter sp.]|uniref:tol-pal system protein YbgF n=1 Tax=Methylobacter sp. TaxID=2051955 RepID=UPI003DA4B9A4
MKSRLLMLLCACSTAYAEPGALPPVIDNSTYPAGAANQGSVPPNAVYELMARVEQLQTEVQQLTGKVEEQAYQIAELKKSQNTLYSDFDERLSSIENNATGGAPADAETVPGQEGAVDPAASAADPAAAPVPAPAAPAANTPAPQPEPTVQQPAAPQASESEKQQYQQAYEALRKGHTSESITQFNTFLSQYPNGAYASNAQYWLGEAHKVNQDINSARTAFNAVIQNYPSSAKAPDALLKLGYIEFDQQNWVKAREYLTRVTVDFPSSTAAHLAKKKLLQLEDAKP